MQKPSFVEGGFLLLYQEYKYPTPASLSSYRKFFDVVS